MLWDLFLTFFKMGAVTFGGGYAMLPILQREVAENKKWSTEEELMDYFAIGQCTPGMIAVNVATFVGYKQKGFSGGLAATLGVITPSMLIITAIAIFLSSFAANPFVIHAFAGIRVCVCVLIFDTVIKLGRKSITDKRTAFIFLSILLISLSPPSLRYSLSFSREQQGTFSCLMQGRKARWRNDLVPDLLGIL